MYQGGSPAGVSLGPDLRVQLPLRLPGWNRVGSLKAQGCPPLGLPRCQSLSPGGGRVVDGHWSAPWAATHEASLQIQATAMATCSSGGAGRCLRLRRRALRASPIFTEWEWLRATRRPPRTGVDIDGQLRATAGESRWTPCSWGLHWGLCPSEKGGAVAGRSIRLGCDRTHVRTGAICEMVRTGYAVALLPWGRPGLRPDGPSARGWWPGSPQ